MRFEKDLRDKKRRVILMTRRDTLQIKAGDFSYSKLERESLKIIRILGLLASLPKPKTPNCSPPRTSPPPPSPDHLAQAINITRLVMDELNAEDERPSSE